MDLCEFKASLVYRGDSRMARTVTQRRHVLKNNTKQNKNNLEKLSKKPSSTRPVSIVPAT